MSLQSLITGLICNKPDDPIGFLEASLNKVRQNPSFEYKWDSFVDEKVLRACEEPAFKSGELVCKIKNMKLLSNILLLQCFFKDLKNASPKATNR